MHRHWLVSISSAAAVLGAAALVTLGPPTAAQGQDKASIIVRNDKDEPLAESFSFNRSVRFMAEMSVAWTKERQCGTCHTNYAFVIASGHLPKSAQPAVNEVSAFFRDRAANWDSGKPKAKPRWDAEVIMTAVSLAFRDRAAGKLHPVTRQALDRMWTLQQEDGSWSWLKCGWPPMESDDHYGATLGAIGVGIAPDDYAKSESAQAGLTRLLQYLRDAEALTLHHRAMALWAAQYHDGLMTKKERQAIVDELLAAQRPDGGWSAASLGSGKWMRKDGTPNEAGEVGDGYGTGFVVYVLRQAGLGKNHKALRQGVKWLKSNQRESGRWYTRSLAKDNYHFLTHAGTAYALMALDACGVKSEPVRAARR